LIERTGSSYLKREQNRVIRQQEELPDEFTDIGLSNGYMALIYADGDQLGQALNACRTLPDIQTMALTLYDIVETAKISAVHRQSLGSHQFDTLLQGGDDLILAVPANDALDIALHLSETFHAETTKRLPKPHTLSTAVVWAHVNFPFSTWLDIAESALKFAKKDGAIRGLSGGLVNFLMISSSHHLDFQELYKHSLTATDAQERQIYRTLRAYTIDDLRCLQDYRRQLCRMSRSKLETLRQSTFQPLNRATFEALRVLVHWRDETSRRILMHMIDDLVYRRTGRHGRALFPFVEMPPQDGGTSTKSYYTPLFDLAELWDFMDGDGHEARTH